MLIKKVSHTHTSFVVLIVVGVVDVAAEEKVPRLWLQPNQR
jgi:hypothetical protein